MSTFSQQLRRYYGWYTNTGQIDEGTALLAKELEAENAEVNGENLRRTLLRVREFDLVGGKATFDDKGDMSAEIQVNEIRGGRVVPIA